MSRILPKSRMYPKELLLLFLLLLPFHMYIHLEDIYFSYLSIYFAKILDSITIRNSVIFHALIPHLSELKDTDTYWASYG